MAAVAAEAAAAGRSWRCLSLMILCLAYCIARSQSFDLQGARQPALGGVSAAALRRQHALRASEESEGDRRPHLDSDAQQLHHMEPSSAEPNLNNLNCNSGASLPSRHGSTERDRAVVVATHAAAALRVQELTARTRRARVAFAALRKRAAAAKADIRALPTQSATLEAVQAVINMFGVYLIVTAVVEALVS